MINVGELVICAFDGAVLSEQTKKYFIQEQVSSFILFAKNGNYQNPTQLTELNQSLQDLVSTYSTHSAIVSVDQEGGVVQRFKNGFTKLPPALEVGTWPNPKIRELAHAQASELAHVGVNLNFAPVCDVATNPANPVIGNRSYGSDPANCARAVKVVIEEHLRMGIQPCLKHFPGHGDTSVDSHFHLPSVDTPLKILRNREWIPFRAGIEAGANAVMSAHVIVKTLDPNFPATLSKAALSPLRDELGFEGIIISDDFQMKALEDHFGYDDAIVRALQAGCDLICTNTFGGAQKAIEAIRCAVSNGKIKEDSIQTKIEAIRKFKTKI